MFFPWCKAIVENDIVMKMRDALISLWSRKNVCYVSVNRQKYCCVAVSFLTSLELSNVSGDLRVMTSTINISEDYQTQYD